MNYKKMIIPMEKNMLLDIIKNGICKENDNCCSYYMMEDGTPIIIECPLLQHRYCTLEYEEDYYEFIDDGEKISTDFFERAVLNKNTHYKEAAIKVYIEFYGTEEKLFEELL